MVTVADKRRRTVSIDEELDEYLEDTENNVSAVVNDLLRQYMAAGRSTEAVLEMRLAEIEQEILQKEQQKTRVENDIQRLERQRDEINAKIQELNREEIQAVQDMVGMITRNEFDKADLVPTNEAVNAHAKRADMQPQQFVDRVETELNDIKGGTNE